MEISIKAGDLKKCKLFVSTPMYGGQCNGLYNKAALDLQTLMASYGVEVRFSFLFNESLITRARNYLVDEFLRSGFTHLLFIDSDIHFDPNDILAMIALDRDVIGGPYPKKSINWSNIARALVQDPTTSAGELEKLAGDYVFNPVPGTTHFDVSEPLEVLEIGTGFMMVKRAVFDVFQEAYPSMSYRPDHMGQANFDGSRYIHAYFDTVIDKGYTYDDIHRLIQKAAAGEDIADESKKMLDVESKASHRYLSEDYMFCLPSTSRVLTEDGVKTMKDIVDNSYAGRVMSFDPQGNSSWQKVVNWSVRDEKKNWVRLNTNTNKTNGVLKCTADHRVAFVSDIFSPVIEYDEAQNLTGKYVVRYAETGRQIHRENPLYNRDQLSAFIGSILADGSISKVGQSAFAHGITQYDYVAHKNELFGGNLSVRSNSGFGEGKEIAVLSVPINQQTKLLRTMLYPNGKKIIENVLPYINAISLAYWYMDDGSTTKQGDFRLSTESFTLEEHEMIAEHFKKTFGVTNPVISPKIVKYQGEDRKYWTLRFNRDDSMILFNFIKDFIVPSMEYKLPAQYHGEEKRSISNVPLDFSVALVKSVEPVKDMGKLYDIEVENNHNFIADSTLVHNCQYWRKLGGKIWLCPWMKTSHVGTYAFKGDMQAIAAMTGRL